MIEWKDTTSYSRGQERIPTCFSVDIDCLRISVLKGHIYYPGKWVMHCSPWFDAHELKVETEQEAKEKAIKLVSAKVSSIYKAFDTALDHISN